LTRLLPNAPDPNSLIDTGVSLDPSSDDPLRLVINCADI
jgi:hypothetical protein